MSFKLPHGRALKSCLALGAFALCVASFAQQDPNGLAVKRQAAQYLESNPGQAYNPYVVLVKFRPGVGESYRAATRAQVGRGRLDKVSLVPGLETISTQIEPSVAAKQLSKLPWVEYAEVDYTVRATVIPNDSSFGVLWGMHNTGQSGGVVDADIDAPEAWDIHKGSSDMVVAVIDTGIQIDHPDLAANIWQNPGEVNGSAGVDDDGNGYIDDINGWNFVTNTANPADGHGHGTHCAGTIGGVGNNGVGVTGVNWNVKLAGLKFLSDSGSGSTSNAVLALQYCQQKGIKVSNNSWGGGGSSQALYDAIKNAGAAGHIFVAAAGNNGTNNDASPFYPASYDADNMITVAATTRNDNRAGFSNYGAISVDLGAPGEAIYSTVRGSTYGTSSGTSMASPHVAGVVALLWSYRPSWTRQQVKDGILTTVRPINALNGLTVTGGVVNAHAALVAARAGQNQPPTVNITNPGDDTTVPSGSSITFSGTATDDIDGNLSSNIQWTSSVSGSLGTGSSVNATLPVGTHVVTASITDSGGLGGSDTVRVTVQAPQNQPPTVTITSPTNNSSANYGATVNFAGSATDGEDGNISANLAWTSSLDGSIGTGASFSRSNLRPGSHVITASVTDNGGLTHSASVNLTINNTAPTVSISSPTNNSTVAQGTSVTFSGSASDPYDGSLSGNIIWTSSIDGQIGTGASFNKSNLSLGAHVITASVTDSGGLTSSATVNLTVNNSAPVVTITSPTNGSTHIAGQAIQFSGSAQDPQDGTLTNIVWRSNGNQIGTGTSFTASLAAGTHVITASVTDSAGSTGQASVTITVNNNTGPTVTITSPANGSVHTAGQGIQFTGTATDPQDGSRTATLVWVSSLSGQIGTGGSFVASLSAGTHVITATATDSLGATGQASVTITVNAPPSTPAAPSNLQSRKLTKRVVELTWSDNSSNETGFTIERQRKVSGNVWGSTTLINVGANTTSYQETPGTGQFRYRIRAYNGAGVSSWTGYINVKI